MMFFLHFHMLPSLSSSYSATYMRLCERDMALCLESLYIFSENLSLCAVYYQRDKTNKIWNLTFDFCWNEDNPSLMFTHHSSFVLYELIRNKGVTNLLN